MSLLCLFLPPSISEEQTGEEQTDRAAWWDQRWSCRKLVRVRPPRFLGRGSSASADDKGDSQDGEGLDLSGVDEELSSVMDPGGRAAQDRFSSLDTATIPIYGEKRSRLDAADVRVVDPRGAIVPYRADPRGDYGFIRIQFQIRPGVSDYYVYFGNPRARRERIESDWRPRLAAIERVTAQCNTRYVWTEDQAIRAFKSAVLYHKAEPLEEINHLRWRAPHKLSSMSNYVSIYHAFLEIEASGTYDFALASVSPAFLSINGKRVLDLSRPRGGGIRVWRAKTQATLEAGVHYLQLIHVFRRKREGLRLGWRPPNIRQFQPVPPSAFVRNFPASEVAYETQEGPVPVFFTVREPSVAVDLDDRRSVALAHFQDASAVSAEQGELRYEWDFGNGDTSADRAPSRCLTIGHPYTVTLRVFEAGRPRGEYTRPVVFGPVDTHENLDLSVDLVSCPNIVYSDEATDISFRVFNGSSSPIRLVSQAEVTSDRGPLPGFTDRIVIPGKSHTAVMLPLNLKDFRGGNGQFTLKMLLAGHPVFEKQVRLARWDQDLSKLRNLRGEFVDAQGQKVILVTDLEDADQYRKWALVKWLHRASDRSAKRVLLIGDALNPVSGDEGSSFKNYVTDLRIMLEPREESLHFHQTEAHLKPIFADLLALPELVRERRPEVVVLCPGLRDLLASTPVRDFTRAIDLMIDVIRAQDQPAKVVLVSPTPLLSRLKVSEQYTNALKKLAEDHHCAFVDLHSALQREPDWEQMLFATDEDDQVLYLYPNEKGQKRIADLIAKEVF